MNRVALPSRLTVLLAATASAATAQTFTQAAPTASPPAMDRHAGAYDAARQETVIFTGVGETWTYDGTTWTQEFPLNAPSARENSAMAFDAARNVVVLFGGRMTGGATRMTDTWEWNGTNWTERFPATVPPGRIGYDLAYDWNRGVCVMFGAFESWLHGPTWEWDGTNWASRTLSPSPGYSDSCRLAYDVNRGVIVYRGGWDGRGGSYDTSTWEYDGTSWTRIETAHAPTGRIWYAMTYDATAGVCVLHGGFAGGMLSDTWQYDGFDWSQAPAAGGPAIAEPSFCFDLTRGLTVLYGGSWQGQDRGDTWEYAAGPIANVTPFGTSCGSVPGGVTLDGATGMLPTLGGTLGLDVGGLPGAAGQCWIALGFTTPLGPIDLGPLGAPGCAIEIPLDFTWSVAASAGAAQASLPMPSTANWLGASLWFQALALDGAANAFGLATSNGVRAKIGV